MTPSQKQAIEQEAEELYPYPKDSDKIIIEIQDIKRKRFIEGATFGLSLNEKRIKELEEEVKHLYKIGSED